MNNIEGKGSVLRIYVGESDTVKGHPLYEEIVVSAKDAGLAGASVFRGILSFGASQSLETLRTFTHEDDKSVVIEIVDSSKNLKAFLPALYEMMDESKKGGLVTLQKLNVLRYRKEKQYNPFRSF